MCVGATSCTETTPMNVDYIWSGIVVLLVLIYLVYALLKPEKF
jgi:K+-transporting ATPase KdpF subunit